MWWLGDKASKSPNYVGARRNLRQIHFYAASDVLVLEQFVTYFRGNSREYQEQYFKEAILECLLAFESVPETGQRTLDDDNNQYWLHPRLGRGATPSNGTHLGPDGPLGPRRCLGPTIQMVPSGP